MADLEDRKENRVAAERNEMPFSSEESENLTALRGEQMFCFDDFSDKEYASSGIVEIADKLLGRMSALIDEKPDTHAVKQLASALKDLRDIRTYGSEIALRKARLRKLGRETEAENGADEIEVVFEAGEEAWNE